MNRVWGLAAILGATLGLPAGADVLQIETTTGLLSSLPGTDLVVTELGGTRTVDLSSIPGYAGCSFTLAVAGFSNDSSELWGGNQGYGMRMTPASNYAPGIDGDRVGVASVYWESVRITITDPVNLADVRWDSLLFGDGDSAGGIESFDLADGEQVSLSGDASGTIAGNGSAFAVAVPGSPAPTAGGLTATAASAGQGGWYLRGFRIDATAVPEPATATLLALGGIAWLLRRRNAA